MRTRGRGWRRVAGRAGHPMRAGRFRIGKRRCACDNRCSIDQLFHASRRDAFLQQRCRSRFSYDPAMTVKVAIAQINSTVGDLAGNSAKIADFARRAAAQGADIVLTPELSLVGYPPEDLLLRPSFYAKS